MRRTSLSSTLRTLLFLLFTTLLLIAIGCNQNSQSGNRCQLSDVSAPNTTKSDAKLTDILKGFPEANVRTPASLETGLCGHLKLSENTRFFNVTGQVTSRVLPGREIKMFITPNTSLNHSLHVVRNCVPFWRSKVNDNGTFRIVDVPPGEYVLYLPVDSFPKGTQGFPIPAEFETPGHRLVVVFQGGDPQNSLGVFRIEEFVTHRSS